MMKYKRIFMSSILGIRIEGLRNTYPENEFIMPIFLMPRVSPARVTYLGIGMEFS